MRDDGIKTAKGHAFAVKNLAGLVAHAADALIGHDFGIGGITGSTACENRPGEADGLVFLCRRRFVKPAAPVSAEIVGSTFRVLLQRAVLHPDGGGLLGELAVFFNTVFRNGEEKAIDVGS